MSTTKIKNFLKQFDQHGAHVNFTYNNKISFQTSIGGVLTILSRLGILAFFFVIVNSVVYKEKTITWSYLGKSPTQDLQQYQIDLTNFDIAFSLTFSDGLAHTYEKTNYFRYYDIKIQYVVNLYTESNGTTTKVKSTTDLSVTNCTIDRFAGLTKEITDYGINQLGWYCPQNISYQLQGQVQSTNQTRFRLTVGTCKNTTANNNYCASSEDIIALTSASRVQIATLNSYFKEDEFKNVPIKRSLSVEAFPIAIGFQQTIQRSLRKTTIITKDSWMSDSIDIQSYMFFQDIAGTIKTATSTTDFLLFTYSCDSQENFVTRKVLSLADAAASAGGFASIVLLFARLISNLYAKPLFYESLLKKLYQYDLYKISPDSEYKQFKQNTNEQKAEQLKVLISGRKNLNLSMIKEYFAFYVLRWIPRCRDTKNHRLFKQGVAQLENALDIEKVLLTLQKMQTIERILLKEYQRKLLRFSSRHMIRNLKPKSEERNPYEIRARTEWYLNELIKRRKDPFNKEIIKEMLGFKKISHTFESSVTAKTFNNSKLYDSRPDQTFSNALVKTVHGGGHQSLAHTIIQFSENDCVSTRREVFKVKSVSKRKKSKKGPALIVSDF